MKLTQAFLSRHTTNETVNITQLLIHLSHSIVFEIPPILCDEHQLPLMVRTTVCCHAMVIEWNGNIETELREINNIDVEVEDFRNSRGDVEGDVFEKTAETIISVFDFVKPSVNPLFDYRSSLFVRVVDVDLRSLD